MLWALLLAAAACATQPAPRVDAPAECLADAALCPRIVPSFQGLLSLAAASQALQQAGRPTIDALAMAEADGQRFLCPARMLAALASQEAAPALLAHLRAFLHQHPDVHGVLESIRPENPPIQAWLAGADSIPDACSRLSRTSFVAWCLLNHCNPAYNAPRKPGELAMRAAIAAAPTQIDHRALVVAIYEQYPARTLSMVLAAARARMPEVPYAELVAMLAIRWYDPAVLLEVTDSFPVASDEMVWNVVRRGSTPQNEALLLRLLARSRVLGAHWTYEADEAIHYTDTSDHRFGRLVARQAKKLAFSKPAYRALKRFYGLS